MATNFFTPEAFDGSQPAALSFAAPFNTECDDINIFGSDDFDSISSSALQRSLINDAWAFEPADQQQSFADANEPFLGDDYTDSYKPMMPPAAAAAAAAAAALQQRPAVVDDGAWMPLDFGDDLFPSVTFNSANSRDDVDVVSQDSREDHAGTHNPPPVHAGKRKLSDGDDEGHDQKRGTAVAEVPLLRLDANKAAPHLRAYVAKCNAAWNDASGRRMSALKVIDVTGAVAAAYAMGGANAAHQQLCFLGSQRFNSHSELVSVELVQALIELDAVSACGSGDCCKCYPSCDL